MRRALGAARSLPLALLLAACADPSGARSFHEPGSNGPTIETLIRPDTPGNTRMFAFDASETVETFGSVEGHFLVHYTRAGADAVPPADTDASGVPDYVELVAKTYEKVLTHYEGMGFTPPVSDQGIADNGGDGRFDVYLIDFAGQGDGNYQNDQCSGDVCAGFMIQENDFVGYGYPSLQVAVNILASHEYFHAIQAGYDSKQGSVIAEGTAVWGTETFDPTLTDFEGFIPGYFDDTERPINQPINGASDPFSYGTCIFWWFLEEHYGSGMVRGLWESTKNGANGIADPQWFDIIDGYLQSKASVGFGDAFLAFATWNLFTYKHADPNRSYKSGLGYPAVQTTDVTAPYAEKALRVYDASAQYYRVALNGQTSMTAAFAASDPSDLDGLAVLLVADTKNVYGDVTTVNDLTNVPSIDVSGADHFVVVVVNKLQTGESKRPGMCIGAPQDIKDCVAGLGAGAGGAGGGASSSSAVTSGGSSSPKKDSGCSVSRDNGGDSWLEIATLCMAMAGLGYGRRRAQS